MLWQRACSQDAAAVIQQTPPQMQQQPQMQQLPQPQQIPQAKLPAPAENADFDHTSAIAVYSREDGSGTRGAFIELFGVEEKDESGEKVDNTTEEAIITNSTDVMLTSVAGDTYAIGYVSLGYLNDTEKTLKINAK